MTQEIEIRINKESTVKDTICFDIQNYEGEDIWFFTFGLISKLHIEDSDGIIIHPVKKSEIDSLNLPEYILIKSKTTEKIYFPIGKLLLQYDLPKEKEYYLLLEYENYHKKPKSKIKTYIGNIIVDPLKLY